MVRKQLPTPPPPRPYPRPHIVTNSYDDRFGYGIDMKGDHEPTRSDGMQDEHRGQSSRPPLSRPTQEIEAATEAPPAQALQVKPSRAIRRRNESQYRKLLKERLKFDKFVTPKGPEPVHHARDPLREKSAPPVPAAPVVELYDDNRYMIADHYDMDPSKPMVLFEESELYGQFTFRDTILDQLDRYWFYLDRMRRNDAGAYGFYKQVGMQILPYAAINAMGKAKRGNPKMTPEKIEKFKSEIKLPPMFNKTRPTFGCVAFGANPKIEQWEEQIKKEHAHWPRFLYYSKYERPPPTVQQVHGGDIYRMCVWYDAANERRRKWGTPIEFAIFIDESGQHIQMLRTCETRWIPVKAHRSLETFDIPDHSWRIPDFFEKWAADIGIDVQTYFCHMFTSVLEDQEYAQYGDVRVQVHKDDRTAIFSIDSRRMGYFFQDRDIELTKDGRRKRVFHVVAPHVRKDGVAVKMHYRGEKHFTWAGYEVDITVPGLDHFLLDEMDIGLSDSYWGYDKKDGISEAEFGTHIVEHIRDGVGARRPKT